VLVWSPIINTIQRLAVGGFQITNCEYAWWYCGCSREGPEGGAWKASGYQHVLLSGDAMLVQHIINFEQIWTAFAEEDLARLFSKTNNAERCAKAFLGMLILREESYRPFWIFKESDSVANNGCTVTTFDCENACTQDFSMKMQIDLHGFGQNWVLAFNYKMVPRWHLGIRNLCKASGGWCYRK
jgi:hypothetical protein